MHLPNHNTHAGNLRRMRFHAEERRKNRIRKTCLLKMVTTNELLHRFSALSHIGGVVQETSSCKFSLKWFWMVSASGALTRTNANPNQRSTLHPKPQGIPTDHFSRTVGSTQSKITKPPGEYDTMSENRNTKSQHKEIHKNVPYWNAQTHYTTNSLVFQTLKKYGQD